MEICNSGVCRVKKMKMEDRISLLPDAILHHILSFLDMKFVMRTSVLGKRWRHLWRSLRTLNFSFSIFCGSNYASTEDDIRFMNFIDQVFIYRDTSAIEKFFLEYNGDYNFEDDPRADETLPDKLYLWVLASVRRGVQALDLGSFYKCKPSLPLCLFYSESLISLKLSVASEENPLILPQSITFDLPRLKSLHLDSVLFPDDNSTNALFAKCPVLESVDIVHCSLKEGSVFNISVPSLKHLGISFSEQLNICAPNLTSFSLKSYLNMNCSIESFSSLTTAEIDVIMKEMSRRPVSFVSAADSENRQRAQQMIRLLNTACNIKALTLSALMVEIISAPNSVVGSLSTKYLNLRSMHLETYLYGECILAIMHLLRISPNIIRLTINLVKKSRLHIRDENMEKAKLLCNEEFVEIGQCILYHLKYVKIRGVRGWANELKFLEILLRSSAVLEKIVMFTSKNTSPDSEERLIKFSEKVLNFRRASSNIAFLFF